MTLRVAIQMDPIESINPHRDSTLLLGVEAQARGHELWLYTPEKLTYCDGEITAQAEQVKLYNNPQKHFERGESAKINLRKMDVILLRQDPPFDMTYITTTYLLEQLQPKVLVANDPASVRNCAEKIYPTEFRQFMPPTMISADITEIENFRSEYKDIIIKPLYGYGGRSVVRLKEDDNNFGVVMEIMFAGGKEPLMAQKFLPEVKTGDCRVTFIDGKVAGVMSRVPAEHEIRSNFRVGGQPIKTELTSRQKEICEALSPELKKRGLLFAGIDLIGDYLTEINVTSPTGIPAMNKLYGLKLEAEIWDVIEAKL